MGGKMDKMAPGQEHLLTGRLGIWLKWNEMDGKDGLGWWLWSHCYVGKVS